jgi:lysozyme
MERVAGIDVSRWQGSINWTKVAAGGYRFVVIRATIGNNYTDPRFQENWHGAQNAGLLVSAYHVVTPQVVPKQQIAYFFEVLGGRRADFPLVLDVEREDKTAPEGITRCVKGCLVDVENGDYRKPIIYTARWFWDRCVLPSPEWRTYDLWVASYTTTPILPRDWKSWRFWQYSESGAVPGSGSRATDLNWFAGSYEELVAYGGKGDGHSGDDQPGEENEQSDDDRDSGAPVRIRVLDSVNVRSGPGASFAKLGKLQAGEVIEARALSGHDVWIEFEAGKWAAFAHKGEIYMKLEK